MSLLYKGVLKTVTVSTSEYYCLSLTNETSDWQLVTCFTTLVQDHIPQLQFSSDGVTEGPVSGRRPVSKMTTVRFSLNCRDEMQPSQDGEHLQENVVTFQVSIVCIASVITTLIFSLSGHQPYTDRHNLRG